MNISKDKVVSLIYELRVNGTEGDIVETLDNSNPLTFLYGNGRLLPKFEANIDGLTIGDKFEFLLDAKEAYGEVNKDAIVNVPISAFEIDGKVDDKMLQVGAQIPMQDSTGNKLTGIVTSIEKEVVVMDFNHPMAGNKLHFKGEITEVREATEQDLQGCGCGSSGCDDTSCGDGGCGDQADKDACGCGC
ncbi:MAG: peptidylprolyl isomerase [Bacteroidales bacterium]|nr:peptidylprolyl isomerase [Bacteroidales bacterium]